MSDPRTKCKAIRSPLGATVTFVEWADGHVGRYPHDVLRGYCPCAGCQGHGPSISFVPPQPGAQTEIDAIEAVGNYALSIRWFDGHDTGIYSYKYLRALCQCADCTGDSQIAEREPLARM